jgi:hypothetical protein
VGVATYDPQSKKFYHHQEPIARGNKSDAGYINSTLKDKLGSKQTLREVRSLAEVEIYQVKAMISERLTTMENQIQSEIKNGGDGTDA